MKEIQDKLDELRNHRSDGVATTADLITILEILEKLAPTHTQYYWTPKKRGR